MTGFGSMKTGQVPSSHPESSRLDRVLVCDDRHGAKACPPLRGCAHPFGEFRQALLGEFEIVGMFEVRLQLSGEVGWEVFPNGIGPAVSETPLHQRLVETNLDSGSLGNDRRRLHGAFQGRRDDQGETGAFEVLAGRDRLTFPRT